MADIREKSTGLLSSTLSGLVSEQGSSTAAEQADALEAAVYEKHGGQTGNEYRDEIRQLSLNLGKNNSDLGKSVARGQVAAQDLTQMNTEQLKSVERAAADSEIKEQGLRESLAEAKLPEHSTVEDGATEVSLGEEGDFKERAQPKIDGLQGIEFETGM